MSRPVSALLAASLLAGGCATAKNGTMGRTVRVVPVAPAPEASGELLAVTDAALWVRGKGAVHQLPLASVREVRVRQHGLGRRAAWAWALAGALVTGGALAGACASVEGTSHCGAALLGSAALWGLAAAIAAPSLEASSQLRVRSKHTDELRRFARFPQGLPRHIAPAELAHEPRPDE